MTLGSMFKFFFSIACLFAVAFGIIFLLMLAIDKYVNSDVKLLGMYVCGLGGLLIGYFFFVCFMFFWLQGFFLSIPGANVEQKSSTEIQNLLNEYFSQANQKAKYFDIENNPDETIITWSRDVKYKQLINMGEANRKILYSFSFDNQKHEVFLTMKEVNFDYELSPTNFNIGLHANWGISIERSTTYIPSFTIADGKLVTKIEKISYNSQDITAPVIKIVTDSGWNIRAGLLRSPLLQNIFLGIAILVWIASLGLTISVYLGLVDLG